MSFNRAKLAPQAIGNISAESKLVEKAKVHEISDSAAEAIQLLFLKNSRLKQMIKTTQINGLLLSLKMKIGDTTRALTKALVSKLSNKFSILFIVESIT